MKLVVRGVVALGLLAGASVVQARPSIGIVTGGCGSPALSKSIGVRARLAPGKSLCFKNDVGAIRSITIESSVAFPFLEVAPESALKAIRLEKGGRLIHLSEGSVTGPEFYIRIEPRDQRVVLTVKSFK
jgi:hypothetical protein